VATSPTGIAQSNAGDLNYHARGFELTLSSAQ